MYDWEDELYEQEYYEKPDNEVFEERQLDLDRDMGEYDYDEPQEVAEDEESDSDLGGIG
jgi:hypothetical protein